MRNLHRTSKLAAVVGAALLVAACGGDDADNQAAAPAPENEMMVDELANDASAIESAVNATEPAPATNTGSEDGNATDVLGETSGGDTGGNTVESNVSGM